MSRSDEMKRFLLNYPQEERISTFLLDFLWNEINVARNSEDYQLWVISPWIMDSRFDLSFKGGFQNLWPGFTKSSISLKQIFKKFLEYNSKIRIVCRPPHLLIPPQNFANFRDMKTTLDELDNLIDQVGKQKDNVVYVGAENEALKEKMSQTLLEIKKKMGYLRFFLDGLRHSCIGFSNVLTFIDDLVNFSPENIEVFFNYRLHAKIILGKYGGFIGSANLTHSGLNYNDEIMAYISDEKTIEKLREMCSNLALSPVDWWKKRADEYSVRREYERQLGIEKLTKIVNDKNLPSDVREALEIVGIIR